MCRSEESGGVWEVRDETYVTRVGKEERAESI